MRYAAPTRHTVGHLRCAAEEGTGRHFLARDGQPEAAEIAARYRGVVAETVRLDIRRGSAPVSMAAAEGWVTREERRDEKKGAGSNGITSGQWQVGTLVAFYCVRCPAAFAMWQDGLGAQDSLLDHARPKRPLGRAAEGGQASGTP
jgi:hypothetical protein